MFFLPKINRNTLKQHESNIFLFILIIVVSLITYYTTTIQINLGPGWDTYDFLANALEFAGKGIGYSDLTRPPFLSFLTSIFFRLGYISETVISLIDSFLFVFGIIGLYLLFKLRFKPIMSFLGSLLFATFPIVLSWVGVGYTDIASVSFSIWAIYFTVLAVKKNSKYFYLSFPILMIAFLTRYPSALIILPVGLYLLINRTHIKKLTDILLGILISTLTLIPVFIFFSNKFGNFLYPFLSFFDVTQQTAVSTEHFAYNPETFYYMSHLTQNIGATGTAILLIILLGLIVYGIKNFKKMNLKLLVYNTKKANISTKIKLSVFIILVIFFFATFGDISYIISEIVFFLIGYVSYELLKNFKTNIDIDLLFLSWFMVFFIFHSVFIIKVERYFILMAVPFTYFLIWGLNEISNRLNVKLKNINFASILSIILVLMLLISTTGFLNSMPPEDSNTQNVIISSNWLKDYDHSYETKMIYADFYWPYYSWYLKMNVSPMPIFKNGNAYYYELKDYYPDSQDNKTYNNELAKNKVDYYFCIRKGLNLTSYKPIKKFGQITLYVKKSY
jgi:4-amino-4-deoxy-L-arabinose transferase-like glycosyltransferase